MLPIYDKVMGSMRPGFLASYFERDITEELDQERCPFFKRDIRDCSKMQ